MDLLPPETFRFGRTPAKIRGKVSLRGDSIKDDTCHGKHGLLKLMSASFVVGLGKEAQVVPVYGGKT